MFCSTRNVRALISQYILIVAVHDKLAGNQGALESLNEIASVAGLIRFHDYEDDEAALNFSLTL